MIQRENIKVILAGGGTGGHLYPGIALAQEFQKRSITKIMFIGTSYGIENKVLPETSYQFKKIWMRGLQRKMSLTNILFPIRLLVSLFQCTGLILSFRPDVIIGTGGYVSGPALIMGIVLGIPTVIQEQNSFPGLVNRLLGARVKQVHLSYEASLPFFKKQPNVFVSGNPVRGEFNKIEKLAALQKFNLSTGKTTLFIFGGSQGAHAINQAILQSMNRLLEISDLQILWATGPADYQMVESSCQANRERIIILPYIEDMASAYATSDIVLSRAGASTLSEIAICGIPAILVPYPYSAAGHQEFNAKTMEKAGAARLIFEYNLKDDILVQTISELINHSEKREAMSQAARELAKPNATVDIVDKIELLMNFTKL